jgi:hypothetical protein
MPYASNRDRNPIQLELEQTPWPAPPLNLFLTSGYLPGVFDLIWDDPSNLSLNSRFTICGVNLYRSFDSEFGPFDRITDLPLGSIFWRDQTDNVLVLEEEVTDDQWLLRGIETTEFHGPRFVFRTVRNPIVKSGSQNIPANSAEDVQVRVDGVLATILRVDGAHGEIEIDPSPYPDVGTQKLTTPVVPGTGSRVTVTYRYNRSLVRTDLMQRVFYRITTVGVPASMPIDMIRPECLVETPLERAVSTSNAEIEKLDWIWREAVRRNHWILDQGGERVKVFLRKHVGQSCPCIQNSTYKQPINDCGLCFGTAILGGYEGPYDVVIAPDDAERRITQRDTGRTVEHTYEVWTGPTPLLSMRDFIVKIDGERYSLGPIHRPSNRGMMLQQHFSIGHLDEKDIRYSVPIDRPRSVTELAPIVPPQNYPAAPTDKPGIPDERELRGRTATWENIVY